MDENVNSIIKGVRDGLSKINALNNELFNSLEPDQLKEVAPIQADINKAVRAIKKGDTKQINKYANRYANSNYK